MNHVFPFLSLTILLAFNNRAGEDGTLDVKNAQVVFVSLFFRVSRHDVLTATHLFAHLLQNSAEHYRILMTLSQEIRTIKTRFHGVRTRPSQF